MKKRGPIRKSVDLDLSSGNDRQNEENEFEFIDELNEEGDEEKKAGLASF